ncbi:MAG: DUF2178 domain-containing protein [Spirochaetia bacterium]|nr:DUF2178 domain-containing protein [Spirochaetia bacterium]
MNLKKYKIMQTVLVIGMLGAISLVMPIRLIGPNFNIFSLPTKNIIAFFGILAVTAGISYMLQRKVKEVMTDERQHHITRKAAYYTLHILLFGFIVAMLSFRLITASDPIPEFELLAKVFSIITGITAWLYIAFYYFFNYRN